MSECKIISLRDVIQKLDYGISTSSTPWKGGPRFLRITDLRHGGVDWLTVPGLGQQVQIGNDQKLKDGDILFARTGGTVGKSFLVFDPPDACFASYLIRLRCKAEMLPAFLSLFLQSDLYWTQITKAARGGAQPNINTQSLAALKLPLLSIKEQERIVVEFDSQLATIAKAREAAQRRVKAAEALEAALFREIFQGITPVVIGPPLEPAPAGLSWKRLSTLAELESGHTPSRRHPEWWGGDIPWIALPDIRALDGRVAMETRGYTNPDGIKNSSARILPKDTVVFGRDVQVGFTTIMGKPMATSQHFFNWICGDNLAPRFLMQALRASKAYMETKSSGAIHQTIYMPAAREFHLCLPDRKQQDKLTAKLDASLGAAAEVISAARAELKAIQALPAAALRRVFGTAGTTP